MQNPTGEILITGGTGFIGRAILKVANDENWDARFTVLSRDDNKQRLLRERYPGVDFVVGDVRDLESLERTFQGKDLIIHAAAFKFIPQAEANPNECIAVNVVGSQNVCRAAVRNGVPKVLGISTDKVCQPVNVYGMTKSLMERIFTDYNRINKTHFALVRYGNVVGSTGSVIPLFQRQHAEGKRLTLTDPQMTRFWLSYKEAINVIKVGLETARFINVIPACRAMSLRSLARTITDEENFDSIGPRPGEKKHEELIHSLESHRVVKYGDYYYLYLEGELPDGHRVPEGFLYRSDLAEILPQSEMRRMIDEAELI